MITITALVKISLEIPLTGRTFLRSISLEPSESTDITPDEFVAAEPQLKSMKALSYLTYVQPAGNPDIADNSLAAGDLTQDLRAQITGSVAIANKPAGGSVGAASATVDMVLSLMVNQTTAAQTLTLPNPSNAGTVRPLFIANVGTTSFTVLGVVIATASATEFLWTGSAWIHVV